MKKCKNDIFKLDIYGTYEEPLFKAIDIAKNFRYSKYTAKFKKYR